MGKLPSEGQTLRLVGGERREATLVFDIHIGHSLGHGEGQSRSRKNMASIRGADYGIDQG
ncbi:hypothetical protein AC579_8939 [Pseudocercospora musae]|uniref:Uncharacterized protein n=1 Tax=Pseudocercospora musae TaxID=113226 RepID=A0A139HPI2_9PEZI|nr:hypothetical protein AC579_8939 [Pseudocercospora musae]